MRYKSIFFLFRNDSVEESANETAGGGGCVVVLLCYCVTSY